MNAKRRQNVLANVGHSSNVKQQLSYDDLLHSFINNNFSALHSYQIDKRLLWRKLKRKLAKSPYSNRHFQVNCHAAARQSFHKLTAENNIKMTKYPIPCVVILGSIIDKGWQGYPKNASKSRFQEIYHFA